MYVLAIRRTSNTSDPVARGRLHPPFLFEEYDHYCGSQSHDRKHDPEVIGIIKEGMFKVLAKDVRNEHGREHNHREKSENLYNLVRSIGKERIVCCFECLDCFFVRDEIVFNLAPVGGKVGEIGIKFLTKE